MRDSIKLSSPETKEFWEIPVLFEDGSLLAINKPSGLSVSPDRDLPERPSLMKLLHAGIERGAPWAKQGAREYLAQSHRLDTEASGVVLLAKSKAVLVVLMNYFGTGPRGRKFVALVQGEPAEKEFTQESKLAPHPARPGLMHVDAKRGKRSTTLFAVRERFARWTLVECATLTDRPHQVRAHLRYAGLPVVGDRLYGGKMLFLSRLKQDYRLKPNKTERPLIATPALHGEALSLPHPVTGAAVRIEAAWPKDLTVAVKYLRRYPVGTGGGG